jgi:protein TonB
MPPLPDTERRLFAASLVASFALHAAFFSVVPLVRDDHPFEPPRVLSVLLSVAAPREEVKDEPPPRAEPPPPRPNLRPRAQPRPEIARAPALPIPRLEPAPAPTPAAEAVPPAPPGLPEPKQEPADAAPPAPVVAAREATTLPDYRAAYLRNPAPAYPAAARRSGEEGTVTLRVLVSADGLPKRVALERSSGSSALDLAALQGVQQWRFVPARRDGEAREAEVLVPIVFRLEPAR